jgi:hypothetical protein
LVAPLLLGAVGGAIAAEPALDAGVPFEVVVVDLKSTSPASSRQPWSID